jgi:type II secretory pathway pseudopilin PulG
MVAPSLTRTFEERSRKGWESQNAANVSLRSLKPIPKSEQGYVLLIAIFLTALLVIALAVAAPNVARSIQRDRDLETFHRGMQYRRAIQLYYRKFHAYPPNVEALVNTNDIRFLRKKYIDPMTGQDDWKPIAFGQNKTPTAMGFFGQPLAGNASTLAGIGPSGGGVGIPGITTPGSTPSGTGFSTTSPSSPNSLFSDTDSNQTPPTSGSGSTGIPSDSSGNTPGGAGSTGSTSSSGNSSTSSSTSGSSGPIIGGAGIIGFEPASPKQSILVYKKKNHYNEWEFTYDPLSDLKTIGGGSTGLNGQQGGGNNSLNGQQGGGNNGLNGQQGGGNNGFGGSGSGSAPMPPDTPAPQ